MHVRDNAFEQREIGARKRKTNLFFATEFEIGIRSFVLICENVTNLYYEVFSRTFFAIRTREFRVSLWVGAAVNRTTGGS